MTEKYIENNNKSNNYLNLLATIIFKWKFKLSILRIFICLCKIKFCFDYLSADSSVGFQCYDSRWLPAHAQCDGQRDCAGKNWEDETIDCGKFGVR